MTSYRLAKSLATLRAEINKAAPKRSKASDGWVGDPAHASRPSRHNPNRNRVVTALDITHDPKGGMDVHALARRLAKDPHPNLAYIISNGETASKATGWRWIRYRGTNPHRLHAHFAVGVGPDSEPTPPYDSIKPWGVATPTSPPEEDDMTPEQAEMLKRVDMRITAIHDTVLRIEGAIPAAVKSIKSYVDLVRKGLAKLIRDPDA